MGSELDPETASLVDDLLKDSRVRLELVPAEGIYAAFNYGIRVARGRFISWLHAGDEWLERDYLESASESLENDGTAVFGVVEFVDDRRRLRRSWKDLQDSDFSWGWMPPHPTVITSRENYNKIGLFDLRYRVSADYDWLVRLSPHVQWVGCKKLVYRLAMGGASTSGLKSQWCKFCEDYNICKENGFSWPLVTAALKRIRKIVQWW